MTFGERLNRIFAQPLGSRFDQERAVRSLSALAQRYPRQARRRLNLPLLERLAAEYDRGEDVHS